MCILAFKETRAQNSASGKGFQRNIDSLLLISKAKLLTLSNYGVDFPDSMTNNLLLQKAYYSHTSLDHYDIIKIENNQRLMISIQTKSGKVSKFCQDEAEDSIPCIYTVVFSYYSYRFFRITGFKDCEVKELDNEMSNNVNNIFDLFSDKLVADLSIDFNCLFKKYLSKEKKYKNLKCFKECGQCTENMKLH